MNTSMINKSLCDQRIPPWPIRASVTNEYLRDQWEPLTNENTPVTNESLFNQREYLRDQQKPLINENTPVINKSPYD